MPATAAISRTAPDLDRPLATQATTRTPGNGTTEFHSPGCRDLKGAKAWEVETHPADMDTLRKLAEDIWGDIATDNAGPGTPEWAAEVEYCFRHDARVMPCLKHLA
jgi:hypothetical protein